MEVFGTAASCSARWRFRRVRRTLAAFLGGRLAPRALAFPSRASRMQAAFLDGRIAPRALVSLCMLRTHAASLGDRLRLVRWFPRRVRHAHGLPHQALTRRLLPLGRLGGPSSPAVPSTTAPPPTGRGWSVLVSTILGALSARSSDSRRGARKRARGSRDPQPSG